MLLRLITAVLALLLVTVPVAAAYSDETGTSSEGALSTVSSMDSAIAAVEKPAPGTGQQGIGAGTVPIVSDQVAPAPPSPLPVPLPRPVEPPVVAPRGPAIPGSIAALGDSITKAFNACGLYFDCEERSWSTGTSAEVDSHFQGLRKLNPAIEGKNFNDAESGAVAADMVGQAQQAVGQKAEYVTLLIGANDACKSTEAQMTSVATYKGQIKAALNAIKSNLPETKVFVASIPNVKRVWETMHGNFAARSVWNLGNICQSMLANPTSNAAADNERRDRVQKRVTDYNAALAQLCAEYGANCKFDNNAVSNFAFSPDLVSNFDFFHPNGKGQNELAKITREAGFDWNESASPLS